MVADVVEAARERVDDADRAAVGDDEDGVAAVALDGLVEERADASREGVERLRVRRAGALSELPLRELLGEPLLDLRRGQSFPGAEGALAQAFVCAHFASELSRDDLRRLARTGEIARVDDVDAVQLGGDATRLLAALVVQLRVGVSLPAAVAIPVGFAVADEKERGHGTHYASDPMDLGLRDKLCLVTGSTGGIGLETAKLLGVEGAKVIVTGRDADRVERARAEAGAVTGVVADLSEPGAADRLISEAGPVECLVNNVGVAYQAAFEDVTDDQWDSMWQLNVMSYVRCIRAVLPAMREAGRGSIVNVSSTAGKRPSTGMPNYSVTKAAVLSVSRLVADLYAKDGIRCNAVTPGPTATEAWLGDGGLADQQAERSNNTRVEVLKAVGSGRPIGRLAEPEEIAAVICFLLSERASYVTGSAWSADGGTVPIII